MPSHGIRFEKSISVGNIMSLCTGVVVMACAWFDLKYDAKFSKAEVIKHELRIQKIEDNQSLISRNLEVLTVLFREHIRTTTKFKDDFTTKQP